MKAKWVIENFVFDNGYEELIAEVKKQGHECCVIRYEPFQSGNYDKVCQDSDCVIFQGSIQLAEQLQKDKPNWKPGVIATWQNYECDHWYHRASSYLFNNNYEFHTVSNLIEYKWEIYRKFGKDAVIWIRPCSGKKPFTARTVDLEEWDKFYNTWIVPYTNPNDRVVISSPKTINGEWRFICGNGKILGVSTYMYQSNRIYIPSAPIKATELCQEVLNNVCMFGAPDKFFSVDICEGIDGKFGLMEFNAFSSCGLYKCNKEVIVREISSYAESLFA